MEAIFEIKSLHVSHRTEHGEKMILKDLNFKVLKNKVLGITGESGCGKSLTALAMMGLTSFYEGLNTKGEVFFENTQLHADDEAQWQKIRGKKMTIVFQNPEMGFNPMVPCGKQIMEAIQCHHPTYSKHQLKSLALASIKDVGLDEANRFFYAYPHQMSGGQLQRMAIAMAIVNKPDMIIADEATSALDTQTSKEIITLLSQIQKNIGCAVVFITHDIRLLLSISDQIMVMQTGRIIDHFDTLSPTFEGVSGYTKDYLKLSQLPQKFRKHTDLTNAQNILQCHEIGKSYTKIAWLPFFQNKLHFVLQGITFTLEPGKMIGILGSSGSGKSTLGKIITGLTSPTTGYVKWNGKLLDWNILALNKKMRQNIQLMLQGAFSSLSPKMRIQEQMLEVVAAGPAHAQHPIRDVHEIFERMGLSIELLDLWPHQLSGGQQQRVVLAKLLLLKPSVIVFDESLSALDVSHQKKIMDLIISLQESQHFCGIFISHDPQLIQYMCHQVMVLDHGLPIQAGTIQDVYDRPLEKTAELLGETRYKS